MKTSRREFLKFSSLTVVGAGLLSFAKKAWAALPLVEPGKGMAAGVKYVHSTKDIKDKTLMIERQGVKWGAQTCANCSLYVVDGKEVGKCALFPNQHVKAAGWCASWNKKM